MGLAGGRWVKQVQYLGHLNRYNQIFMTRNLARFELARSVNYALRKNQLIGQFIFFQVLDHVYYFNARAGHLWYDAIIPISTIEPCGQIPELKVKLLVLGD